MLDTYPISDDGLKLNKNLSFLLSFQFLSPEKLPFLKSRRLDMKLRIRSTATKETLKVQTPDPCTLSHLKSLISAKLSLTIPPESIRLSLNREVELVAEGLDDTLDSLGLTSGDLLFFSLAPCLEIVTLAPAAEEPGESSNVAAIPLAKAPIQACDDPLVKQPEVDRHKIDTIAERSNFEQITDSEERKEMGKPSMSIDLQQGSMEVDPVPVVLEESSLSIPGFLQRVLEAEKGEAEGILGRLVVIIHAALLESGFVVYGSGGSRLPEGWAENVAILSVRYTVPELLVCNEGKDVKPAILKFSLMGNFATAYGYLSNDHCDVYRMCFDLFKLAPLLSSDMDSLSKSLEKEVFQLWKLVKDGLSLPLLTDICLKNGLPLPPCFMLLPTELKIKVLQSASGVDVARFGCTCSEMRYLTSNDELWKQKLTEEFGSLNEKELEGNSWKAKFANCRAKKRHREKMMLSAEMALRANINGPRLGPFRPLRFPVIGGDYDLFPGGRLPMAQRFGNHPYRRNFSPNCYFGGNSFGDIGRQNH